MELVFVYGTLKQGQRNHVCLDKARFVQQDTLPGRLYYYGHHTFPYAVPFGGELGTISYGWEIPRIHGEVYEVDDALLSRLDRLEGTPQHYQRARQYTTDKGQCVWVYEPSELTRLQASEIEVIPTGKFTASV